METVTEFTFLGDKVSAGGGCEAAVTPRTKCGWIKLKGRGKFLHSRKFPLNLKEVVYKSYVRPAILHGSEAWCLKESDMGTLRRTERCMARTMCGVQLKDRKRSMDLMLILALNETKK